ncbi:MAG: dihydropteroate synthase [Paludibacteraceae bacterium]|nr:dihydropteroate synthase [Paludibacteraceae bacterium]
MYCGKKNLTINCGGHLISLAEPLVMGIVNITPDSFFADSRYNFSACADADILDIGACSTRPEAVQCSEKEELERLKNAANEIKADCKGKILSIDTYRPAVAKYAIENLGADIINDISGGCEEMFKLAAEYRKAYVLTYSEDGGPDKMLFRFSEKIDTLAKLGMADIILDPGIGFNKTLETNYDIIRNLNVLKEFGLPVLVGVSRKSLIYKALNITLEESLNGTTALNTIILEKGADILRVHDVKEAKEAIKLFQLTR